MNKYSWAAIIGGAILSVASASASTSTFQFNTDTATWTNAGAFGDSAKFSSTTANATIFAYSNATNTSTNTADFQSAELGQSTGTASVTPVGTPTPPNVTIPLGLTDCNRNETLGCDSPSHQVDNSAGFDFVLIEFSAKVNLDSLTLSTYQGNGSTDSQDFSYITGSGAFPTINAGSTTLSSLLGNNESLMTQVSCATAGFNTSALHNCDTGASNTYTPTGPAGGSFGANGVTWVMIAAQDPNAGGSDYFKISDLAISSSVTATPEPATFGLIGLALTGLGVYGRRRKSSNN